MVPLVGSVFSPLGWPAGLVTWLNRHGYFISRPLKRTDPTHDPRKARRPSGQGWADETRARKPGLPSLSRRSNAPH